MRETIAMPTQLEIQSPHYSSYPEETRARILAFLHGIRLTQDYLDSVDRPPDGERYYNALVEYVHGKRSLNDDYRKLQGRSADFRRLINDGCEELTVHQILTGDDVNLGLGVGDLLCD
jgi:hypothetical protein